MNPLDEKAEPTVRVGRLRRLGVRRITRAHLSLDRRPEVLELGKAALEHSVDALGNALGVSVSCSGRLLEASWPAQRVLSRDGAYGLLDFTALGSEGVLEVDRTFLASVLARLSEGTPPAASPVAALTRIEASAFGYLLLVAIQALRREAGFEDHLAPRLSGVTTDLATAREHLREGVHVMVELRLCLGETHGIARLILSAETLQTFALQSPETVSAQAQQPWLQAALPARCCLAGSSLPSDSADDLKRGDVVLLTGAKLNSAQVLGSCFIRTLGFSLQGELTAEGFYLVSAFPRSTPLENPMPTPASTETSLLPVQVEVELARLQLPLGELVALQPGRVLALHISASEPVLLRIGDRRVARAELVDIDGEVGARILSLLP